MEDLNANRFFQTTPYEISWPFPPIIITDHLKTPENLGQIIRLAGNVGSVKVLAVHEGESLKLSKVQKMANVAGQVVEWQFCTKEEVLNLLPNEYILTALETAPNSKNIFTSTLPQKMALIVGNESQGISDFLLQKAKVKVHIPVMGSIKSLNVSHAASVCLFEWIRQQSIELW